jgi:uncharacterized protein YneF (UPF0154 family)
MAMDMLRDFFMWCMIINLGILLFVFVVCLVMRKLIYKIHSTFFPMTYEEFNRSLYMLMGIHKSLVFIFSVIPYIALCIID